MGTISYEKGLRVPRTVKELVQQHENTIEALQHEIQNAEEQIHQAYMEQEEVLRSHGLRFGFNANSFQHLVVKGVLG